MLVWKDQPVGVLPRTASEKSEDSLFHSLDNTAVQDILTVATANGHTKTCTIQFARIQDIHALSGACQVFQSLYTYCRNHAVYSPVNYPVGTRCSLSPYLPLFYSPPFFLHPVQGSKPDARLADFPVLACSVSTLLSNN